MLLILKTDAAHSLDLKEAYNMALQHNPGYLSQKYDYEASKTFKMQGLAYLLPQISFSINDSPLYFTAAPYYYNNYTARTYQVNIEQPIFNLSNFANYQEFNTKFKMGQLRFEDANNQLRFNVADAYLDALYAKDALKLAEQEREDAAADLVLAQKLFDAGESTKSDIDAARSRDAISASKLIEAKNKLDIAVSKLKGLIGRPPESLATLKDNINFDYPNPNNLNYWVSAAQQNSPVVKYYQESVNYYKEDLKKSIGGQTPTISLNLGYISTNTSNYTQTQNVNYESVGVSVNVPIFDGGNTIAKIQESNYRVKQASMDEANYKTNVIQAVTESFLNMQTDVAKIQSLNVAVASDTSSLKATYMGIKAGTKTLLDVLSVKKDLYSEEEQLLEAKYDYIKNSLKLKLNAGVLTDKDIEATNAYLASDDEQKSTRE